MSQNTIEYRYQLLHFPKEGMKYGSFHATKPGLAAEKILHKIYKMKMDKVKQFTDESSFLIFKFENVDTKKEYCYIGKMVTLEQPIQVKTKNGKEIIYKNRAIVARMNPFFLASHIQTDEK
jgi:hypothetical protein